MRPALADRLCVVGIAGALVLWCGCLVLLWAMAFDSSGLSTLSALTALSAAIAVTAGLPGRAARTMQRLLGRLHLQELPAMELATARSSGGGRGGARAMTNLLAAAAIFAVACGVASTVAIYGGKWLADVLPAKLSATPLEWRVLGLLVLFVGMLPMGLGVSVAFLVSTLLRGGSGRDTYATAFREWLLGAALGLAGLGLAWWIGANLLGTGLVTAVLLLAGAGLLLQRRRVTVRPRAPVRPIEAGKQRRERMGIAVGFAVLTLGLTVQSRLLRDVFAADMSIVTWWTCLSLLLLAGALRKVDHKSQAPGRRQGIGAAAGVSACLMLQVALGMGCLAAGRDGVALGVLAGVGQIPLAVLGAVVLSRGRRTFAIGGGRARSYLSSAAAGAAVGMATYVLAMSAARGGVLLLGIPIGVLTFAVVRGIGLARRVAHHVRWAVCGGLLMCAVTGGLVAGVHRVQRKVGSVRPGVWLTAVATRGNPVGPARPAGSLPRIRTWRHQAVTEALAVVLSDPRYGRKWWMVLHSRMDLPVELPARVFAVVSAPDAAMLRGPSWGEGLLADGDGLCAPVSNSDSFDGVLIAPLPLDHPQAWRCYNGSTMRWYLRRAHREAVIALRTQVPRDRPEAVAAVARTFQTVVGSGWVAIGIARGTVDVLLVGPEEVAARPASAEGLHVVPLGRFLEGPMRRIGPFRILSPSGGMRGVGAGKIDLREWLGQLAETQQD